MKINIIHQYFKTPETGGAIRSYHIAKYLIQQGHDVTVITAYNGEKQLTEQQEGIKVIYLPVYYSNHLGFWSRIKAFSRFVIKAIQVLAKQPKSELNYVITTPLTTGIIAIYSRWRKGVPYVLEVGDLWPSAPIQLGVLKSSVLKSLAFYLEKKTYDRAERIVALSPEIEQHIQKIVPEKHITCIPNFSDLDYFSWSSSSEKGMLHVAYIGTVGLANHLEYLVEVANMSKNNSDLKFTIMGDGARLQTVKTKVESYKLNNIDIHQEGDKDEARKMLMESDAAYISFKNVPVLTSGSPNKFFDALAAGKLIILNFKGWIQELVEQNDCGFYYNPERPEEFVSKIQPYIENNNKLLDAQRNARALAKSFDLNHQLTLLDEVIEIG